MKHSFPHLVRRAVVGAFVGVFTLVALWEWRGGPTPWLWMVKK